MWIAIDYYSHERNCLKWFTEYCMLVEMLVMLWKNDQPYQFDESNWFLNQIKFMYYLNTFNTNEIKAIWPDFEPSCHYSLKYKS